MLPRTLAITLALMFTLGAPGIGSPLGDAGGDGDAGDGPADATDLPGAGTYQGWLVPPGDADWYRLDVPASLAVCLEARVTGTAVAEAVLSPNVGAHPAAKRDILPGVPANLGFATPFTNDAYLGLDTNRIRASGGAYGFSLEARTAADFGPGDGGSGRDASAAMPVPVQDPCVKGDLSSDDLRDVLTFHAEEGSRLMLSLAQSGSRSIQLTLYAPDGTPSTSIRSDESTNVILNATGIWTLEALLTTDTQDTYLVGFTMQDPPKTPPCRPNCVIFST